MKVQKTSYLYVGGGQLTLPDAMKFRERVIGSDWSRRKENDSSVDKPPPVAESSHAHPPTSSTNTPLITMGGKAKFQKHTAKELSLKQDQKNKGGGGSGLQTRTVAKLNFVCEICKVRTHVYAFIHHCCH